MPWLSKLAGWVERVLLPWGGWGLAPAAFLDSSFLSLAGGVDLWLVSLCVRDSGQASFYVVVATTGSLAGAAALYGTVRRAGEVFVEKRVSSARLAKVRQKVERFGSWALLVAALLPPPTPFKLFIIAAGALKHPFQKFVLALLVGRLIRYSVVALLAVRFGRQAWELLLRTGPWVVVGVLLAVVLALVGRRFFRRTTPVSN